MKILPADKGRVTVIMNTTEYDSKIRELLKDVTTYKKLSSDPTNKFKTKVVKLLKQWKDQNKISYSLWQRLYPTAAVTPKFYGLPKVHKNAVPLRPIVSSMGSITFQAAKLLAKILGPLVGKTPHHVKNSLDFVKKITNLEVPPPWKLISFDVTALFTSIPTDEAMTVVRNKLISDQSWKERTTLQEDDILELLDICMNTTYFIYQQEYYQQQHGIAMGSPISPIIANLYMEEFEKEAIKSAKTPPKVWFRYVDDTFTMLHMYDVEIFANHLNSLNPNIKFTHEVEEDGTLAFLDVLVHVEEDGSIKTTVFRKKTHTDQYLNFKSNHHLEHKRSVVRTLLHRADNLVTEKEDKKKEIRHIKAALHANNYEPWLMNIPSKKQPNRDPPEKTTAQKDRIPIALPYIKGISEPLGRVFKKYNINVYHKPMNTLKQLLVHPKDPTPNSQKTGIVYRINCKSCNKFYIGETGRTLGKRLDEHKKLTSSAICEHLSDTGHTIDWENTKILYKEDHPIKRKIKESIAIKKHKPSLNRDQGWDLPPILCNLLSHDLTPGGHVTN